jgi:hypothetical protein
MAFNANPKKALMPRPKRLNRKLQELPPNKDKLPRLPDVRVNWNVPLLKPVPMLNVLSKLHLLEMSTLPTR